MLIDYPTWTTQRWSELVPEVDPAVMLTAINVVRVAKRFRQEQARALAPWKPQGIISVDDYRIVALLRQAGETPTTGGDIAEALDLKKATVSNRLEKLETHGLVFRVPNELDGRSHHLLLNPNKVEMVDDMYRAVASSYQNILNKATRSQQTGLNKTLEQLRQ